MHNNIDADEILKARGFNLNYLIKIIFLFIFKRKIFKICTSKYSFQKYQRAEAV